ncbi:conserved peptide upstream open reading frame 35 [Striga asiatica]|uniref:Conserved peptide upstream open reading frame 35 n=1 Tax=Striga asiatica TaxID=4170 RepID=A0A5A7P0J8_STRAF|nr:conserved peptide upstream open reading frame 35 [Striga asiatica]
MAALAYHHHQQHHIERKRSAFLGISFGGFDLCFSWVDLQGCVDYKLSCRLSLRMRIAAASEKIQILKELRQINMSVGSIAFYQLMKVCQAEYFRQLLKPVT